MRSLRTLAILIALAAWPAAAETEAGGQNEGNDPLTPKAALQVQDYFQPVLLGQPGQGANQVNLRAVMPSETLGIRQLGRVTLPVVSTAWGTPDTVTGLGDLTIFDMAVFLVDKAKFGIGPLVVAPTATSRALGEGKWQGGVQTILSLQHAWGLTAGLVSYQKAFDASRETLTLQPLLFYNLGSGFYLRSSGVATFDLRQTAVVPVGLGIGRVIDLPGGRLLNVFVEPQYSVVQSGLGVPSFQVYAGINIQFPLTAPMK